MSALSDYITSTRRILRDANSNFFSDAELTDYINVARRKTALDTRCLRSLETVTLTTSTETYTLSTATTKTTRAIDVVNIIVLWGNQRVPLEWMAWTNFNAHLRIWSSWTNMPVAWSNYGTSLGQIYVGPIPDQNYTSYWDIFYYPADLVDGSSTDELAFPFTDPVPYYAASTAKLKQQNYGESEVLMQKYRQKCAWAISEGYTRRLPNVYA